ncbi:polysaccharide biosynthesis/export family protein [Novosphingobium profundi]|uniref:polysaccharide biosynthesis/export family protein n=1 Tax=Novosphingobium profundi TaxID=1774954 RepID=UPI001CFF5472|nr:polysaccharide biosynthesis/export family protein [Novosphingobium profundi]
MKIAGFFPIDFRFDMTPRHALALSALVLLGACSTLPRSGPSTDEINDLPASSTETGVPVQVVDVNAQVAQRLKSHEIPQSFHADLGEVPPYGSIVGRGDVLSISIWEAPPALLFGFGMSTESSSAAEQAGRGVPLPEQIVEADGTISVPFAGRITAAGKTPQDIATAIKSKLAGKAHDPQVIVRIAQNSTADVTVIGDVTNSLRMPLSPKGERLLDALASAGGVRQPIGKMTVQITRGDKVVAMPLSQVINRPTENVRLEPNDVVTALYQPFSFTVLGAAGRNDEVSFESTGLTLSQALGRIGGLDDQKANARGVFIFRFEDPEVLGVRSDPLQTQASDNRIPIIYKIDMRNPSTLFAAQSFPIRDDDLIYVSNAPLTDFSKFLRAVSQIVYPIVAIQNANMF